MKEGHEKSYNEDNAVERATREIQSTNSESEKKTRVFQHDTSKYIIITGSKHHAL